MIRMTTSRRLKRVMIAWESFRVLFTAGDHPTNWYRVVSDAIPADAVLLEARYAYPGCIELLLYAPAFDEVPVEGDPPLLEVTCELIR